MRAVLVLLMAVVLGACVSPRSSHLSVGTVVGPASSPGTAGAPAPVRPVSTMTPAAPRQRPLDSAERALDDMSSELAWVELLMQQSPPDTAALQVSFERLGELGRYVAGRLPPAAAAGAGMSGPDYLEMRRTFACLVDGFELLMLWSPPSRSDADGTDAGPLSRSLAQLDAKAERVGDAPKVTTALPLLLRLFVGTASRTGIRSGARSAVPRATVPQTGAAGRATAGAGAAAATGTAGSRAMAAPRIGAMPRSVAPSRAAPVARPAPTARAPIRPAVGSASQRTAMLDQLRTAYDWTEATRILSDFC